MTVFAGLAEFERELIRERARVGRDAAQKRGVRFGRPPKLNTIQRALANRLLSEGQSAKQVAKVLGVDVQQFTVLLARTLPEWYGEHSLNRFSVPMLPNTQAA